MNTFERPADFTDLSTAAVDALIALGHLPDAEWEAAPEEWRSLRGTISSALVDADMSLAEAARQAGVSVAFILDFIAKGGVTASDWSLQF